MSGGMVFRPLPKNKGADDMENKQGAFLDEMDDMEMPPQGAGIPGMDEIEDMAETDTASEMPDLSSIPDEVLQAELDKRMGGNPMTGKPPAKPGMMPPAGVMPPMEGPGSY